MFLRVFLSTGDTTFSWCLFFPPSQVADLKRANNLLTEQDFFALRSVKIPVRRFSILTETHITGLHKPASPSGARRLPPIASVTSLPTESSTDSSSSADSVEGFLLEKDKDIEQLVKSTGPSRNSLNEVVSSLQQPQQGEFSYKPAQKKDPYYGADWGMRWWTAVAIMLVVGIVTPVFYLLYYEVLMKADVSHHIVPTQPLGDVHQRNVDTNNLQYLDLKEIRKGDGPGNNPGKIVEGNLQEPLLDRIGDGDGTLEKTWGIDKYKNVTNSMM